MPREDLRPAQNNATPSTFQEQALTLGMTNWIRSFAATAHIQTIQWVPAGPAEGLFPTFMSFSQDRRPAGSKKKNSSASGSKKRPQSPPPSKNMTRRNLLAGLGAVGALAGIAYWLHTPGEESSLLPAAETREQRIQHRLVVSAMIAVKRINEGFLDDSPDKKEILGLLENFIRAPRILPRAQNTDDEYGYLSVDIADGGAIRVDYELFDKSSDYYDDAILVHEFTHQTSRQLIRQKLGHVLKEENQKDPNGAIRDGKEGDRQRHISKQFLALKLRNEGEAHENEVMRYARRIAQLEGVSFNEWLGKNAIKNPYFGIFKKFLKPDGTVSMEDVRVEMVMQGYFVNPLRQYGLIVIAWKEGILQVKTVHAMYEWLPSKENIFPHLDPEESRRFRAWLASWLNDPTYNDASAPSPASGFVIPARIVSEAAKESRPLTRVPNSPSIDFIYSFFGRSGTPAEDYRGLADFAVGARADYKTIDDELQQLHQRSIRVFGQNADYLALQTHTDLPMPAYLEGTDDTGGADMVFFSTQFRRFRLDVHAFKRTLLGCFGKGDLQKEFERVYSWILERMLHEVGHVMAFLGVVRYRDQNAELEVELARHDLLTRFSHTESESNLLSGFMEDHLAEHYRASVPREGRQSDVYTGGFFDSVNAFFRNKSGDEITPSEIIFIARDIVRLESNGMPEKAQQLMDQWVDPMEQRHPQSYARLIATIRYYRVVRDGLIYDEQWHKNPRRVQPEMLRAA